jgi:hypothetical protein
MKTYAEGMLASLQEPTGRFAELAEDLGLDTNALTTRLLGIGDDSTLEDFFPESVEPHYTLAGQCALIAKLLVDAGYSGGREAIAERHNLHVGRRTIVPSGLIVKGMLVVKSQLVVMGDLTVDSYTDEFSATSVAGAFHAKRGVYSMGMLSVVGKVKTPFLCLDFNQGYAKLLGGCDVGLLVESDHGGSRIVGPLKAKFVKVDELVGDEDVENTPSEALETLLHDDVKSEAMALVDDHNVGPTLWNSLASGKQLLRDEASAAAFFELSQEDLAAIAAQKSKVVPNVEIEDDVEKAPFTIEDAPVAKSIWRRPMRGPK